MSHSFDKKFYTTTSARTHRYECSDLFERQHLSLCPKVIRSQVPNGRARTARPEGKLYFHHTAGNVVTEHYIVSYDISGAIMLIRKRVHALAESRGLRSAIPVEEIGNDPDLKQQQLYSLKDWEENRVFLELFIMDLPLCEDHSKLAICEYFWSDRVHFSKNVSIPDNKLHLVIPTLAHPKAQLKICSAPRTTAGSAHLQMLFHSQKAYVMMDIKDIPRLISPHQQFIDLHELLGTRLLQTKLVRSGFTPPTSHSYQHLSVIPLPLRPEPAVRLQLDFCLKKNWRLAPTTSVHQRGLAQAPIGSQRSHFTLGREYSRESYGNQWLRFLHPEGYSYFCHTGGRILTTSNIQSRAVHSAIIFFDTYLRLKAERNGLELSNNTELVLYLVFTAKETVCYYYFINLDSRVEFWIEEDPLKILGLHTVTQLTQRRVELVLAEHYWAHVQHFPMHRPMSENAVTNLALVGIPRNRHALGIYAASPPSYSTSESDSDPWTPAQRERFWQLFAHPIPENDGVRTYIVADLLRSFKHWQWNNLNLLRPTNRSLFHSVPASSIPTRAHSSHPDWMAIEIIALIVIFVEVLASSKLQSEGYNKATLVSTSLAIMSATLATFHSRGGLRDDARNNRKSTSLSKQTFLEMTLPRTIFLCSLIAHFCSWMTYLRSSEFSPYARASTLLLCFGELFSVILPVWYWRDHGPEHVV